MKSILVVGHDSRTFRDALATTWQVAERYESYVEGIAMRAWVPAVSFAGIEGIGAGTIESLVAEDNDHARRLKSIFLDFTRGHEVCADPGTNERGTVIANWPVDSPELMDSLGERGRVFDLIVIGRSKRGQNARAGGPRSALLGAFVRVGSLDNQICTN